MHASRNLPDKLEFTMKMFICVPNRVLFNPKIIFLN